MKKATLLLFLCAFAWSAFGQGKPWYDHEAIPVCWDSLGTTHQLYSIKVYRIGRDTAVKRIYTDHNRQEIVPSVGTLIRGTCGDYNPQVPTPYDAHLQTFTPNSSLTTYSPSFLFSEYREVVIFNHTAAIVRVSFNVSNVSGTLIQFVPPFSTLNLPQPKNLAWHQTKFSNLEIAASVGFENVGNPDPVPHVIVNAKNYD